MEVGADGRALYEAINGTDGQLDAGSSSSIEEDWNWVWNKKNTGEEEDRQEKGDSGDSQTQYQPSRDSSSEDSRSESSHGDDKYYEPIDMPLTWIRRHDWRYWEQRIQDPRSGVERTEIKLFSPDNRLSRDIYDPRLSDGTQFNRRLRYWMLDFNKLAKPFEPQRYPPEPIGRSSFEKFCPVTSQRTVQPVLLHVMDYLTQRDVDMVRATSKTLRASWPEKIMGKSAYCKMLLPFESYNKLISRLTDQPKPDRKICGSRNRKHAIIPCEGNKLGIAKHGPAHDICDSCHISTLWDMRQAMRYVFGRHKRLRICQSCRIKFGPATELQEFCRCEDSIANSRLCWDCRRTLIWRTFCRNNKNGMGPTLPNGIRIKGRKFPHCVNADVCDWCLHFSNLKKNGECCVASCVHCPTENANEKRVWGKEREEEEEAVDTPSDFKEEPDFEDDQLFFEHLFEDFSTYEIHEELKFPQCPVCSIDIDSLTEAIEERPPDPQFGEKYTFLCLACGDVCASNRLKHRYPVSKIRHV